MDDLSYEELRKKLIEEMQSHQKDISASATQAALERDAMNQAMHDLQNSLAQSHIQQQQINQMAQYGSQNIGSMGAYGSSFSSGVGGGGAGGGYTQSFQGAAEVMEEVRIKSKELKLDKAAGVILKVLETSIVPFLWGPPGVGKSSLVREICAQKNWKLIDLRLSLLNPVDLRGLPVLDKENQQADWYPPSFLPKYDDKEMGILFLDEINLAPLSVQAAAYQLILDKRVGEYRFPPHWKIIAAGNRETDKANVYKISAPLANRFIHFTVTPDFESWKSWAIKNSIRDEVVNFLLLRPTSLLKMPTDSQKAFPSPRTWNFVSDLLTAFDYSEDIGVTEEIEQMVIGTIGEPDGKEFLKFLGSYKMKEISKQVEEFVKTGKVTLPRALSMRYSLITAIYDAYKAGKVNQGHYDKFVARLSGEEKRTLAEYDKEEQEMATPAVHPTPGKWMTTLYRDLDTTTNQMIVVDAQGFNSHGFAIIFDQHNSVEVVQYDNPVNSQIIQIQRAKQGTSSQAWPAGTFIQPL
jgi:hypothetical protein